MQVAVGATAYGCISRLTLARVKVGDGGALREYARYVATTSPRTPSVYDLKNVLEPMKTHPTDKDVEAAARTMFGPGGAWIPLVLASKVGSGAEYYLADLVPTDLLRVAAFREHVEALLSDMHTAGTIKVRDGGGFTVEMDGGWQTYMSVITGERAEPGTRAVRVADYYASMLAARRGAPPFQLYWPERRRNEALRAARAYVHAVR